jgi:DDE superfamily endonuclease
MTTWRTSKYQYWQTLLASDTDSDEDDNEAALFVFVLAAAEDEEMQDNFHVRYRLQWDCHVAELSNEPNAFYKLYRMSYQSFVKLCCLIRPFFSPNERLSNRMSNNRSMGKGALTTEIALHCLLRWLAGGSHLDIRICVGISISSFYRMCYRCLHAVLMVDKLKYHFPKTTQDVDEAARGFRDCSAHNVLEGCVACLDGLLLRIQTPAASETGHVKSYFSGHYQTYGVNAQAACDRYGRFVFACLAAPGGANDISAFRMTKLPELIECLPVGKYVVGDNAYICTEHLLTPFSGNQRKDASRDAYNFYLSQLRIRIEMTFGVFVNKWQIFKRPLQVELKHLGKLFMCATRLHNFCISEQLESGMADPLLQQQQDIVRESGFLPSVAPLTVTSVRGNSIMRDLLVEHIQSMALSRPAYNLRRNQDHGVI